MEGGGAERRSLGGRIPEEVQQQARQKESPVLSEQLVAARKGLTERVVQLLHQDPSNAAVTDKHGRTCLHLACIAGHLYTALAILQSGYLPIDSVTKRGHTALHETCQEGYIHLSLLLISLGASLQARSREGWTPLMCACSRGHLQLVEIVAATGGEVNDLTTVKLKSELEQERARLALLEAQLRQTTKEDDETTDAESPILNSNGDQLQSLRQNHIKPGSPIVKSASSSDLSAASSRPPATRLPTHSPPQHSSNRVSITEMVSECLRNPSSMSSIRSNLKADNLTPRIQRKFRYKAMSATLPTVGSVPSPLTHEGARAPETGSQGAAPTSILPSDK